MFEPLGQKIQEKLQGLSFIHKKEAAAFCQQLKLELKRSYFQDAFAKCGDDNKQRWCLIKQFWPFKRKSGQISIINGKSDDLEKAVEINWVFVNVAVDLADRIEAPDFDLPDIPCHPPVFEFRPVSEYDVALLIQFMWD